MAVKVIALRYAGICAQCGAALPARTKAQWDATARTTTCLTCVNGVPTGSREEVIPPSVSESGSTPASDALPMSGRAGASAQKKYEQGHERRAAQIEKRWGRFSGVVKVLTEDPQSVRAWKTGAEGERRLAEGLTKRLGDRAILLHDCSVPKTRGNIDHLAVSATGVWIVDAKMYQGRVERRNKGGVFKADYRLYVNGRDRTKLVHGLTWQVDAVRAALSDFDVPVHAALCFIDAEWSMFQKPFKIDDYWVTWGKTLAEMIGAPGSLTENEVANVAGRLASALPPVIPVT